MLFGKSTGVRINLTLAIFSSGLVSSMQANGLEPPDFDLEIAPLLVGRCLECHQDRDPSGGLVFTSKASAMAGGEGGPVIVPGIPDESKLVKRIMLGEMPPEQKGISRQLPDEEIALLRRWVQAGADWPEERTLDLYEATSDVRGGQDWWSLQSVKRVTPPIVKHAALVNNPIDAFVLARLAEADMEPAPLADRLDLIRRVYYDVIGLPPSYEQVQAFVSDDREDAWERVVDALLDSPQFGEKWARHWLDLVRFAESCGYERDQEKPFAWRYRDWVVDALNEDMPYDQFVLQQLAGDELPGRTERTVIATGLLRLGTWNDEPNDAHDYKYERLEDLVHVTSSAFLGITVKCARCHDHKFDPIPQTDYYRMAAIFWPGAVEPRDATYQGGPTPTELGYDNVLGWTDLTSSPQPFHLLKQGDRQKPGDVVQAGVLSAVPSLLKPFEPPLAEVASTRRRLQFARWIVDPRNPLTARVLVNRLWQHHFGQGLVRTPNNFGFKGDPPTHPELLDWLSDELVRNEWKMKYLHKLILMSRTYRQATVHPQFDLYQKRDAYNRLWWRSERRRLDAEALRDTMLLVTGELDQTRGGPSFRPSIDLTALEGLSRKDAAWVASPPGQQLRRSLYIFTQRSLLLPMMTTFNFCDTISPNGQRDSTITPTQALALLNNSFSHDRSNALANRVIDSGATALTDQIRYAWQYAIGREPTDREEQLSLEHLEEQRKHFAKDDEASPSELLSLASLCHMLMNSNEFIYVE